MLTFLRVISTVDGLVFNCNLIRRFYSTKQREHQFWVSCHKGLERLVAEELEGDMIRAQNVEVGQAGVHCSGPDHGVGYRANLWLRTGARVFLKLTEGDLNPNQPGGDELYKFGREMVRWTNYLQDKQTFRWTANVFGCTDIPIANLVQQRLRDAVCDAIRDAYGVKPKKPKQQRYADVPFHATVYKDHITIYRDLTGESLNKRGYRPKKHTAMLSESVAAAMLLYSGWDKAPDGSILIDPLCGSGTILLEAALIAKNEAPGSYRLTWPFMRWPDFDQQLWKDSLEQAWANKKMFNGQIIGLDRDENRIRYAKFCRGEARAKKVMELNVAYLESWVMRQKPDFVITNPPWGMQMLGVDQSVTDEERQQQEQELEFVWKTLGKFLKEQCQGSQASVYCGRPDLLNLLGLKSKQTQVIQAGGMSTRLDLFDVPVVEELAPTQEVASIA